MYDVWTLCVFLGSFILCAIVVHFVFKYGSKEKTYEEAQEEIRRQIQNEKKKSANSNLKKDKADKKGKFSKKKTEKKGGGDFNDNSPSEESADVTPPPNTLEPSVEEPQKISPPKKEAKKESTPEPVKIKEEEEVIVKEAQLVAASAPVVASAPPVATVVVTPIETKPALPINNNTKKMVKKPIDENAQPKLTMNTVLSFVKKTKMDDGECQHLIELLLNKQTSGGGEWMSNSSNGGLSVKTLQKKLAEKETELEESDARTRSIVEKLGLVRKELNSTTALSSQYQRLYEESKVNHEKELASISSQMMKTIELHKNDIVGLQNQLSVQVNRNNALENSLSQPDPSLLAELDSLRHSKEAVETQAVGLRIAMENEVQKAEQIRSQMVPMAGEMEAVIKQLEARQSEIETLKVNHEHELAGIHSQMTKMIELHNNDVEALKNQLSVQVSQNKELESNLSQADPSLVAEIESLRCAKEAAETRIHELRLEIDNAGKEVVQVAKDAEERLKESKAENQSDKEKMKNMEKDLLRNLDVVDEKVKLLESKNTTLMNEKCELSKQLATIQEQFKAQEEEVKQNGKMNGHKEEIQEENIWEKKYSIISKEKEAIIIQWESVVSSLKTDLETSNKSLKGVMEDLELQKTKNNELRTKNWKVMEALKSAEQEMAKRSANSEESDKMRAKLRSDYETSQKSFLKRIFPTFSSEVGDHSKWLAEYETRFTDFVSKLTSECEESRSTIEKLERRVQHFQSILAETEKVLSSLQSNVESQELSWNQKLSEKEKVLDQLLSERDALLKKNAAMEESLQDVNQAQEVAQDYAIFIGEQKKITDYLQSTLQQLQDKLNSEELEKQDLRNKLTQVQTDLQLKNKIEQELAETKDKLDSVSNSKTKLALQMARKDHLLDYGQDALLGEKKTVQLLNEQTCPKADIQVNNDHSVNGVETVSKHDSSPGSVVSLALSDSSNQGSEKVTAKKTTWNEKKKKSKKKKF